MATCIHSSGSCLPPFYTIPIFPLLKRKVFHLLVHFKTPSFTFSMGLNYNRTTGVDRPHQNTYSVKLANNMVCKCVKFKDVNFPHSSSSSSLIQHA